MWIANFLICIILYSRILYLWSRKRLDECLTWILFGFFCGPVFRLGSLEVNGSYFITLILVVLCADNFRYGKIRIRRDCYLLFQIWAICLMLIAGALNGKFNISVLVPLIGHINIAVGTFGCILFFKRVNNPFLILRQAIVKANMCHILFGALQLTNVSIAYRVTSQLYATASRSTPLDAMLQLGKFARIFGATFSPTILGGYVLFAFSFVFALVLLEKGKRKKDLLLLLSTVLLGFMAFSKTAIIGMPIIGAMFLLWILFHGGVRYRKLFSKSIGLLLVAFGFTVLFAWYFGLLGQVGYYFGTLLSDPLRAFRGRYGNSIGMWDPSATSGIAGTMALFRKHPVIGVGMATVLDEFIGDTQYISLLHNGGIVLFVMILLFYISVYVRQREVKGLPQMMILTALMLGGLASNVLTVTNYVPFVALCVGVHGIKTQAECSIKELKKNFFSGIYQTETGGYSDVGKRRKGM